MKTYRYIFVLQAVLLPAPGCAPSEEAARITRPLRVDGGGLAPVVTDLGYTVTLSAARASLTQLTFTRAPTAVARGPIHWLIGTAHAHPGHGDGGDVIGELPGRYVIDWFADDGLVLGDAVLIGAANTLQFTFAQLAEGTGSVHLAGVAARDGVEHPFDVAVDLDTFRVDGVPFEDGAVDSQGWGLRLSVADPFEGDTLFDGVDFATATWAAGDEAYNRLGRALRTHDHYLVSGVAR